MSLLARSPELRRGLRAITARVRAPVLRLIDAMRAAGLSDIDVAELDPLVANAWIISSYRGDRSLPPLPHRILIMARTPMTTLALAKIDIEEKTTDLRLRPKGRLAVDLADYLRAYAEVNGPIDLDVLVPHPASRTCSAPSWTPIEAFRPGGRAARERLRRVSDL